MDVEMATGARQIVAGCRQGGALATAGMVGTLLLLIWVIPANLAMLTPTFPPQAVPAELTAWYR